MHVLSVNIAAATPINNGKTSGVTGIFKMPAASLSIGVEGVAGDFISDTDNHGGPDQAVYAYSAQDYAWWSAEVGQPIAPGTFGENLTLDGLAFAPLCIGDRVQVGAVLLEVTAPRIPCATLNARMADAQFVKRFKAAARPGFYARVLTPGEVRAGDPIRHLPYPGETLSVVEMFHLWYTQMTLDEATLQRVLRAPGAIRLRRAFEDRLAALHAG